MELESIHPKLHLMIDSHEIENTAWNQIMNTLNIDPLIQFAVMPDVHTGYDLVIGGVVLIDGYIWPGAVGYDIGCGMCHVNTMKTASKLNLENEKDKFELYNEILNTIPVGPNSREFTKYTSSPFPGSCNDKQTIQKVENKMDNQLGTLGGGNHFIEIGINSQDEVGITIHSGSRNPGHTIGEYYMNLAKIQGTKFGKELAMFPINSGYGQSYYDDMNWALNYALKNRTIMMNEVLNCLNIENSTKYIEKHMINENHNHAILYSDNAVLHRKGATPAERGQLGIIPSNQRDGVYITEGLGHKGSINSASHGVGRRKSRKKAKKEIELDTFKEQMSGIICRTDKEILDEAPDAYKDVNHIINMQDGSLVNVLDHFSPIIVVKG